MTHDQLIHEYDKAIRERVKWEMREAALRAEIVRRIEEAEKKQAMPLPEPVPDIVMRGGFS